VPNALTKVQTVYVIFLGMGLAVLVLLSTVLPKYIMDYLLGVYLFISIVGLITFCIN